MLKIAHKQEASKQAIIECNYGVILLIFRNAQNNIKMQFLCRCCCRKKGSQQKNDDDEITTTK